MVDFLKDNNFIPEEKPVAHGFFGRNGGVSHGVYASLNCGIGSNDVPNDVIENRMRVANALGAKNLLSVKQVHGRICHYVRKAWDINERPEGDAFITDVPGLALGILTADCGPVLFYGERDGGAPVIGAAHAGWGGALNGILEETLAGMMAQGVKQDTICASIGPCIGPKSYEVQDGFANPFIAQDQGNEHFFKSGPRDGHLMFDLPGYIASRLALAGVSRVSITGVDTYSAEDEYFSYRRATHKGEQDYGRQISALVIRA